jgi:lactoylglutathione lyase
MAFRFDHNSLNVRDLERSLAFYDRALDFREVRRIEDPGFTLVFLGDGRTNHRLELTWLKDRAEPYDLGDNEFHLALVADDYEEARERHRRMGCIAYENEEMGLYFIEDPDGYWIEILPDRS